MNFQEKVVETAADLRARAAALADVAVTSAHAHLELAAKRVNGLKGSFQALTLAGREFNKVARRHAARFVKENSTIAVDAGKDVSTLARSTYASLTGRTAPKARKTSATRKRAVRKAA